MNIPSNSSVRTRLVTRTRDGRLSLPDFGPFLTACALHRFPVATSSSILGHASQLPTTEGEGWDHLVTQYRHRGIESREGALGYNASQGRFWFRQRPSYDD